LALLVRKHMATLKQIAANRRNALKSTGPTTPEGKAAVRMNSLRHGLRARTVVLPGESRDEFNQLCDDLEAEWQPESRTAQFYLEQMAISQWKLMRMEVGEANIFAETVSGKAQIPLLDRLWQAQGRLERAYARAQRELERLQYRRPHWIHQSDEDVEETPAPQPAASPAARKPPPDPIVADFMPATTARNAAAFVSIEPDRRAPS
jgi:hypothetical protein